MGYEIAGGLGVKMAHPDREVVVMLGDGSYMMMNSELATSVMLGQKLIVVLLDNRGFGCINRLQIATGGASFNNLLDTARHVVPSAIDFAAHAAAMGATAEKVDGIAELEAAMKRARAATGSYVVVIDTDPHGRPPRPAAPGGTSPSPRSPPARPCARRARTTKRGANSSGWWTEHDPLRHQPHRLVERRRPDPRRGHPARAVPARGRRDRLRRHREGPQDARPTPRR